MSTRACPENPESTRNLLEFIKNKQTGKMAECNRNTFKSSSFLLHYYKYHSWEWK